MTGCLVIWKTNRCMVGMVGSRLDKLKDREGGKNGEKNWKKQFRQNTNTLELLYAAAVEESPQRCASALSSVSLKSSAAP